MNIWKREWKYSKFWVERCVFNYELIGQLNHFVLCLSKNKNAFLDIFFGKKSFELDIYIENGNLFYYFCFYWIWCEQTSIRQPIYGRIKGNKLPIYFQCKLSQAHCYAEGMSFHRKRTDSTANKKKTDRLCNMQRGSRMQ